MRIALWLILLDAMRCAALTMAAELPPAEQPIEGVIDQQIASKIAADNVTTAPQIDDSNLVRRLTLDLAGRIPTTAEAKAFVESASPGKRVELVDRLLASPDFVFHQRNEFDALLQPSRQSDEFRKYLLWAVEQNRPWDRMFRDMLAGDTSDEHQKAALQFVRSRVKSLDDITIDTSVLFFGVNVGCAKCHDHPLVEDWKQDHFYGMSSFFSRTYLTKKEDTLGEKFVGEVKFKTTKGEEKQARFMFLTGSVVEEPQVERSADELKKVDEAIRQAMKEDKADLPPQPDFNARAQLVDVALREGDNKFFAKSIVNRLMVRLLGRGLVDPPDQMHSANPASHPDLLEWLARDLVTHGYDLKRLIRGIALSQTYSRSSQWDSAAYPPEPKYFAVAIPRPLSPRQYALSLLIAAANPQELPVPDNSDTWKKRREQLEGAANGLAGQFEQPRDNFQIAVDEALLFSNSTRIESDLLRDSNDRLLGHLKTLSDDPARIDVAYWSIASRAPTADESAAILDYLSKHASNPADALKQAIWSLISGPELRFNY